MNKKILEIIAFATGILFLVGIVGYFAFARTPSHETSEKSVSTSEPTPTPKLTPTPAPTGATLSDSGFGFGVRSCNLTLIHNEKMKTG